MSGRACDWCKEPIPPTARRDAKTCSKSCRQAKHRFKVGVAPDSSATRRMHFGYADPPYPGMARRYYGGSAQEVNHRILIGTMERCYPDGWALSTSTKALAEVLAICPSGARVCPWVKGAIASVAYGAHNSWEPLIVVGGRSRRIEASERIEDSLLWGGRQHSHPDALTGMKPAAFCEWMFRLLGCEQGDTLDDIFPGSGAVGRAWGIHMSQEYSSTPSRLREAQMRLTTRLSGTDTTPSCLADATDDPIQKGRS